MDERKQARIETAVACIGYSIVLFGFIALLKMMLQN
jgi:hypothetical protein